MNAISASLFGPQLQNPEDAESADRFDIVVGGELKQATQLSRHVQFGRQLDLDADAAPAPGGVRYPP